MLVLQGEGRGEAARGTGGASMQVASGEGKAGMKVSVQIGLRGALRWREGQRWGKGDGWKS